MSDSLKCGCKGTVCLKEAEFRQTTLTPSHLKEVHLNDNQSQTVRFDAL